MATPIELIDRARALADTAGRADLHRRLALVRERMEAPSVRVLVVGEPKQGKSQLVNALVGAPVCPVADDVATVVPTVIREGSAARAELVYDAAEGMPGGGAAQPTVDGQVERVPYRSSPCRRARRAVRSLPTAANSSAQRSSCPAASSPAGSSWSTPPGSGVSARGTRCRPSISCPARTRSSWSPMPPRSTPPRRCRSSGTRWRCAPPSCAW
ncbi:dynamin family protein [Blastococcus brunescens]|uniref:Dynamin family protein n=1 Tax=Blastococcus brunescens TaxID=1564165 RepID=A0ABZ1B0G7_9ACTN|nr:dynamin family protein [Blastococcus sp. BMG 8361]WRL63872.1 dynamin family protein [Blastococcus sp. BMG 8361]